MPFQWYLRFKSPLSPTKGVYTVVIETDTDSEAEKQLVAKDYLDREMSHPSTRMIPPILPVVVNSARAMRDRAKAAAESAKAKPKDGDEPDAAAAAGRGTASTRVGA